MINPDARAAAASGHGVSTIVTPASAKRSIAASTAVRTSGCSESKKKDLGMPTRRGRSSRLSAGAEPTPALANTFHMTQVSSTVRAIGPIVSRDHDSGKTPATSSWPNAGLKPVTPQAAAGMRMLPPVSDPMTPRQAPTATAAADPPELPPGIRLGFHGLRAGGLKVPAANSWVVVFPRITAPPSIKVRTDEAF